MPKRPYSFEFWATPKLIQERTDLTPIDKDVISVFVTRFNGEAPLKMKEETIAKYIGCDKRSIIRSISKLKKKKILIVGKSWKLNTYILSQDKLSSD